MVNPNAFIEKNPKEILKGLAEFCIEKEIKYFYDKRSYKFVMRIPMSQDKLINFWIIFEKGKKKSTKDLYRLRFLAEKDNS